MPESIFRIRRYSGTEGGSNFYHHADIIARTLRVAMKAVEMGLVVNWRWIDRFDQATSTYCRYEFMGRVPLEQAKNPARPLTLKERRK